MSRGTRRGVIRRIWTERVLKSVALLGASVFDREIVFSMVVIGCGIEGRPCQSCQSVQERDVNRLHLGSIFLHILYRSWVYFCLAYLWLNHQHALPALSNSLRCTSPQSTSTFLQIFSCTLGLEHVIVAIYHDLHTLIQIERITTAVAHYE